MSIAARTLSCFAFAAAMLSFTADLAAQSPQALKPTLTAPDSPQPNGPTRPDPDGGDVLEFHAPPALTRDLALEPNFMLAGIQTAWGYTAIVQAAAASDKQNGKCSFRYQYATRNLGLLASLATQNRIRFQTMNGAVMSSQVLPALAHNATANSSGKVWLAPGTWMLYVHADATAANAESNEANNLRRVKVTVQGSCN